MTLLPIGSVVSLKDADSLVMIYGHLQKDINMGIIYDYIGCDYPIGVIDTECCILFQDETIERVSFIGLQDEESIDYLIAISRYLEKTELTGERRA